MSDTPTTLAELFRSLGLSLTVRAIEDEDEAWACTLTRPDGTTHEIESVSFFDVDPDTGEEWIVEPTPSRVLSVLAGGGPPLPGRRGLRDPAAPGRGRAGVGPGPGPVSRSLLPPDQSGRSAERRGLQAGTPMADASSSFDGSTSTFPPGIRTTGIAR